MSATVSDGNPGYALVTGASGGIGEAIARLLARRGYRLAVAARSVEKLHELAAELGPSTRVYAGDLCEPGAPEALLRALNEDGLEIAILVNNAGTGDFASFTAANPDRLLRMIRLNVEAVTTLTRGLLPGMIVRGAGRVLNIASVASFQPGPLMAVYYASKAYVLSLSEALSEEVSGTGVSVTAVCPGPVRTGFQSAAGVPSSVVLTPFIVPSAESVARFACRAMFAGRRVAVHGAGFKLLLFLERFLPRAVAARIVHKAQERRAD